MNFERPKILPRKVEFKRQRCFMGITFSANRLMISVGHYTSLQTKPKGLF